MSSNARVLNKLAALRVPTVAKINGQCLGGGLELTLACDWRICEEGSKLGFPGNSTWPYPRSGWNAKNSSSYWTPSIIRSNLNWQKNRWQKRLLNWVN